MPVNPAASTTSCWTDRRARRGWSWLGAVAVVAAVGLAGCGTNKTLVAIDTDGGASGAGAGGSVRLGALEVAQRLSRFIWSQPADAAFLAAVQSAAPASAADVRLIARGMLTDARARAGVGAFYQWWLGLDQIGAVTKDPTAFPQWTSALRAAAAAEPRTFGTFVTLDGDGLYVTLMTAPFSFVNQDLAAVYGLAGVTGGELRQVMLEPTQRGGLLTQPGLLALYADATLPRISGRGFFVERTLLCGDLPTPPADEAGFTLQPGSTQRQQVASITHTSGCSVCHATIDPLGFGLQNFDAIGQFRTTESGQPIDASGTWPSPGAPVPYDGPREEAALLATRKEARTCFSRQWLQFALGRTLETADQPSVSAAYARFATTGFDIRELIAAVAATDAFLAP